MTRLPKLFALLSALVATSTMACGPCPSPEEEVIVFDPMAASLAESFQRCELDANDCDDLCRGVYKLMHGPGSSDYLDFNTCELVDVNDMPAVHYLVSQQCIGGRLPAGAQLDEEKCSSTEAGAWFAKLAELEEASVYAFVMLSKELRRFQAPASLSERCLAAAAEEVQHARLVAGLARRFGGVVQPIATPELLDNRSVAEVALENAREGCVRETFGALVAVWQAQHAQDRVVRQVMSQIAVDESRHAELSADIDSWARSVLDSEQQHQLDQAKTQAIALLASSMDQAISEELITMAGLPNGLSSRLLFQQAQESIWA